ncbi:MAG TPA: ATP-dependent DNA ligase [Acidimicrobiia bacterium]|nr:ATP-dependent DNA ligase [Acidimicrobiia bacterium]
MLLAEIVDISDSVSSTAARSKKIGLLADLLGHLGPDEARIGVAFLAGRPTQTKLGVGPATVYGMEQPPASKPSLEIIEVDSILEEVSGTSGPGSKTSRERLLRDLLQRATEREQEYLRGLMVRNLRQGALEGVMAEAVATAVGVDPTRVRRAAMLEGDLIAVAARALVDGPDALKTAAMEVGTPVQPMLAKTAASAGEAIDGLGAGLVERKLDGLRLQVHRDGDRVAVYTRNLRDITAEVPSVAAAALALAAESFILDGEGLVVGSEGSPMSFQDSMTRPGDDAGHLLTAFYFDVLHLDGEDLVDAPLVDRRRALERFLPPACRVESIVTDDPAVADEFFEASVAAGFEGVVVKDLTQAYEAGRRGSGWLKVKPTHTLDLVILAAEWGSGRREGWLSNLHLGAVGPDGDYVMLGKTFKGLTDEMLEWQTEAFLEIEDHRKGHAVFLKPEIVYEIAFDGVQRSTRYPGGVALRFARVKGVREDKNPEDADTLETVRSYLR